MNTSATRRTYTLALANGNFKQPSLWGDACWSKVAAGQVDQFHPDSSSHRPNTRFKAIYDPRAIHLFFQVQDRYVICKHTQLHEAVCKDSCVEFFVQPKRDLGYFNFEFNCGGTMLVSYVRPNSTNPAERVRMFTPGQAQQVAIHPSLPGVIDPELTGPVEWTLQVSIPFALLEEYVGKLGPIAGQTWHANFYKCAGDSSQPHWAAWAPIGPVLSFHQVDKFAPIRFA